MFSLFSGLAKNVEMDLFTDSTKFADNILQDTIFWGNKRQPEQLSLILRTMGNHFDFHKLFERKHSGELEIIVYGAGFLGKKRIPEFIKCGISISQIWDKKETGEICGIKITKPDFSCLSSESIIVVCIKNPSVFLEITELFQSFGVTDIFSYQQFSKIAECFRTSKDMPIHAEDYRTILRNIEKLNPVKVDSSCPTVLFDYVYLEKPVDTLYENIMSKLVFANIDDTGAVEIKNLSKTLAEVKTLTDALIGTEILLRKIFSFDVKSAQIPLKLNDSFPYDKHSLYFIICEICEFLFTDNEQRILFIKQLLTLSIDVNVPLLCNMATYLMKSGDLEQALKFVRKAKYYEPYSLLADDVFIEVAEAITKSGGFVDENSIDFLTFRENLKTMYCRSGLCFASIVAYDAIKKDAVFTGCFRNIQCSSALNNAVFWTGDEWKEFRRSVTDGSFRYCLKTRCPNIVGGWLPKKDREFDEDDVNCAKLTELHLSYDYHCPLHCNSCRNTSTLNSCERTSELDKFYHTKIKQMLPQLEHLTLSGCGEAIVSPHSVKLLQDLSSKKYPNLLVELRTNGVCFSKSAWGNIGTGKECVKHITVSVDAADKETFEKLRQPAKWDVLLRNLEFLKELRDAGEIEFFEFGVVIQRENLYQLTDLIKMAIAFSADVISFYMIENWNKFSPEEYIKINVCSPDNDLYEEFTRIRNEIKTIRHEINAGISSLIKPNSKKIMISMFFETDDEDLELKQIHNNFVVR